MNTISFPSPSSSATSHRRALVLGGGGAAGNAWLIGVVAGLNEGGLDAVDADLVVGTSAGATAAVQLTGADPADLLDAVLAAPLPLRPGRASTPGMDRPIEDHLARTNAIIASSHDAAEMRRRIGGAAMESDGASDPAVQARWRATVASRLPAPTWPEGRMLLTAVDASTGDGVAFDRDSGVELVDAVAASCAGGFAYTIDGTAYIDGGYRRNENADLAAGFSRVLVLSPLGGRSRHPEAWRMQLSAQLEDLRAGGSRVATILPDEEALRALGGTLMDPAMRVPAARAGHAQGLALADGLAELWS
jgi:NTE family protein